MMKQTCSKCIEYTCGMSCAQHVL